MASFGHKPLVTVVNVVIATFPGQHDDAVGKSKSHAVPQGTALFVGHVTTKAGAQLVNSIRNPVACPAMVLLTTMSSTLSPATNPLVILNELQLDAPEKFPWYCPLRSKLAESSAAMRPDS